ncbi:MAG TPA: VWA domain-containing protein [Cellvibrio sp.]|nr:VWA domain-containing protein [Cellvibrio sp.]
MSKYDMNEHDLEQLLKQQPPAPEADAKARHIAAAMAAFAAPQNADVNAAKPVEDLSPNRESGNEEKKSNILQGFLPRLRLTRDTNQHGTHPMNSINSSANNNSFDNRPFWQKPALISGIAASSLAVIAGVAFMQHLTVDPIESDLASRIAAQAPLNEPELAKAAPAREQKQEVEEVVITQDNLRTDEAEARTLAYAEAESAAARAQVEKPAPDAKKMALAAQAKEDFARAAPPPAPAVSMASPPVAASIAAPMATPTEIAEPTADMVATAPQEFRDRFEDFKENAVVAVSENPVSTFSIDVDTASYSFVRRMLNNGQLPEKDAVRSEEMINYFDYAYPAPTSKKTPFATYTHVMDSPWKAGNKLIHIGIQGYQLAASEIPQSNLVFLLDVSGSMDEPSKLPLVKQSMSLLLDTLKPDDTISIVVYAGAAGTVLAPTKVKEKAKILAALNNLQAGGSTAGAEGIALAYQLAEANFNAKGVNRIILATDGDFNVGETGDEALQDFVERKRDKGIYLSVLGFGQGNYQDEMMQTLAQNGNGTAAYIDTLSEAQKVLVTEATSNLFPIAKDVKIQVEFNPATVKEYRLIGYETRALKREDFNNDKVDAGEIGAGQRVTAIYEITPVGAESGLLEANRYQQETKPTAGKNSEYAFVRLRYKLPHETKSNLIETPVTLDGIKKANAAYQQEVNFATAVAGFAQLLKGSAYAGDFTYDKVIELAQANKGKDEFGYRTEFIQLVRKAKIAQ